MEFYLCAVTVLEHVWNISEARQACTCHMLVSSVATDVSAVCVVLCCVWCVVLGFVLLCLLQSPLTLVQKVKCLVNSYPFWPDYDLLACMASSRTATA